MGCTDSLLGGSPAMRIGDPCPRAMAEDVESLQSLVGALLDLGVVCMPDAHRPPQSPPPIDSASPALHHPSMRCPQPGMSHEDGRGDCLVPPAKRATTHQQLSRVLHGHPLAICKMSAQCVRCHQAVLAQWFIALLLQPLACNHQAAGNPTGGLHHCLVKALLPCLGDSDTRMWGRSLRQQ